MADDRDRFRPKTPPPGVAIQLAREPSQRELDELTPVRAIASVRTELKGEIAEIRGDVGEVRGEVRELAGEVRALTGAVGDVGGQLKLVPALIDELAKTRDAERQNDSVVLTTQVAVQQHRAMTDIDQGAKDLEAAREIKKALVIKGIAIVSTLVAALLAALQTGIL